MVTYADFNVALDWSRMNFDTWAIFVDWVDNSVKDFFVEWFERDHIELDTENNVAWCVLDDTLEISFFDVIVEDINDIPKLFSAWADKLLVDPSF